MKTCAGGLGRSASEVAYLLCAFGKLSKPDELFHHLDTLTVAFALDVLNKVEEVSGAIVGFDKWLICFNDMRHCFDELGYQLDEEGSRKVLAIRFFYGTPRCIQKALRLVGNLYIRTIKNQIFRGRRPTC